jgi:Fe2+ transport system protein B
VVVAGWVWDGFVAGVQRIVSLWWLLPLFIAIQILKDSGYLERVSRWMGWLLRPLRLPGDAGLPMIAGLSVGLTYGSGIILQAREEGKLTRDELTVACVALGCCHALVEETLLMTAAGASGVILVAARALTGLACGLIASRALLR